VNLVSLVKLVPGRHDDENIDVAVGVWPAIGIGTEEDDLVRPKPLGDLPSKSPDHRHRDIGAAIPPGGFRSVETVGFGPHKAILHRTQVEGGYCLCLPGWNCEICALNPLDGY
jgi:hypothetical protein